MKRKIFEFYAKRILVAFYLLIVCMGSKSQIESKAQTHPPAKPYMWVDWHIGNSREQEFIKKHDLINSKLHIDENLSIFYPKQSFCDMICYFKDILHYEYLKIDIACYPVSDPDANKLILIFEPLDGAFHSFGYFTMRDNGIFTKPSRPNSIDGSALDPTTAVNWIDHYVTFVMRPLIGALDAANPENWFNNDPSQVSDTRSIVYCKRDVQQLIDEIDYQNTSIHKNNSFVTGLKEIFSSYDPTGNQCRNYANRLILQFEFTTKDPSDASGKTNIVFYIDSQDNDPNFGSRDPQPASCFQGSCNFFRKDYEKNGWIASYDNGQLCPTYCPQ